MGGSSNFRAFNYINRVADALGLDPEPEMQEAFQRWRKSSEQSK